MSLRARVNFAWFLRGIAKRLNDRANRIDPIKLNVTIVAPAESFAGRTSREQAQQAIARAMQPTSLWGEQRAARR